MSTVLSVTGLTRHFGVRSRKGLFGERQTVRAVDGVSFAIDQGRTLSLVGESGCGKSTTANLALGLLPATAGEVSFEGEVVDAKRDEAWRQRRRRMQMVYQNPLGVLDRRLSIHAQVCEPLTVFRLGDKAERRARAAEVMKSVGLPEHLFDRYPHELSGGQRQRVVVARALVLEPSLLVCDEPTSALDVSVQAQVINLFQDIQARTGVAMLFISHDLKVVRRVSHEVAVMYLGKIVEQGPPDEVFFAPAHPYTQALVSAIPSPWERERRERILLSGEPPNPAQVPPGCAFHPRCSHARAECHVQVPALRPVGGGRLAACHLVPEAPLLRSDSPAPVIATPAAPAPADAALAV